MFIVSFLSPDPRNAYIMAKITKDGVRDCIKGSALTLATLAGVIGGVIFGLALRSSKPEGGK